MAALLLSSFALVGAERLVYADPMVFSPMGWLWGWIHLLFPLGFVWWGFSLARRGLAHPEPVAAWLLLSQLAMVPAALMLRAWAVMGQQDWMPATLRHNTAHWVVFGVCLLWICLALWRITQALHAQRAMRVWVPVGTTALIAVQSWAFSSSSWAPDLSAQPPVQHLELSQSVFLAQEALLEKTLQGLDARPSDQGRVFGLVYAPYAGDVFRRESAMVTQRLSERLDARGRVVQLLNHAEATEQIPWATPLNLRRAIRALAARMDKDRDVLVMYLTSHGGSDHVLASSHWPLEVEDLSAGELRQWLDEAGIRYRAIAVSACYSGGWIDPLKGPDTLIMTAADAQHTSYGCGWKSDFTYFGKAVFEEGLSSTSSLEEAFTSAVPIIRERERAAGKDDGFSNPQIDIGEGFRQRWPRLMGSPPAG